MRILIAVMLLVGLAVYAYGQVDVPGSPGQSRQGPPPERPTYEVSEKDYKAALKRVPDAKTKFDPWSGVREAPKSKK